MKKYLFVIVGLLLTGPVFGLDWTEMSDVTDMDLAVYYGEAGEYTTFIISNLDQSINLGQLVDTGTGAFTALSEITAARVMMSVNSVSAPDLPPAGSVMTVLFNLGTGLIYLPDMDGAIDLYLDTKYSVGSDYYINTYFDAAGANLAQDALCSPTPSPDTTPTPTPVVTPTPEFTPVPPVEVPDQPLVLYYEFTGTVTDQLLTNTADYRPWKTPDGRRLMITNIYWSCLSEVTGTLEWDKSPTDRFVDKVYFGAANQGKCDGRFDPPLQDEGGVNLILTTNPSSAGVVRINGYLR